MILRSEMVSEPRFREILSECEELCRILSASITNPIRQRSSTFSIHNSQFTIHNSETLP